MPADGNESNDHMKTFDRDGNLILNKGDIDRLLDRFDQTEVNLQRQIVAAFVGLAAEARDLLQEVRDDEAFGQMPEGLVTRIEEFLS